MRSLKYLNTILTVLTVLLGLNLYTQWTISGPPLVSQAQASGRANPSPLDAGAQQKQMIDLLKVLVQKTEEQTDLFRSGKARVSMDAPVQCRV